MEKNEYDMVVKVVIVGAMGVGKSSLIQRFVEDSFTNGRRSTPGVEFHIKLMKIGEKVVKLQIWDTAGQERFNTLTRSYFRDADVVIFAFDPNDPKTLQHNVTYFLNCDSMQLVSPDAYKCLVATKTDIAIGRDDKNLISNLSLFAMPLLWTSAKSNSNVYDIFYGAASYCLEHKSVQNDGHINVAIKNTTTTKKSCNC
jgi:Ras-related protein Rab-1A